MRLQIIVAAVAVLGTAAALPYGAADQSDSKAVVNTRFVTYENGLQKKDEEGEARAVVNTRFVTYENGLQKKDEEGDARAVVNTRFVTYENGLRK